MRVLIVEDNDGVAELYRNYLTELGHASIVAPTAEAAFQALETEAPEAMMLDPALPGLNGSEFLQHRSVGGASLPLVAISSHASEEQARECLRLGALDYARKPVSLARLAELVGFLELHALNKHVAERVQNLDRRRALRIPVSFPVRITDTTGAEWVGLSVDLSPFGLQVRTPHELKEGAMVKLSFTLPDGSPPLTLLSVLARTTETDGYAFLFVNLTVAEFRRLSATVRKLSDLPR
jgi:CheY-like chemotaxis protein